MLARCGQKFQETTRSVFIIRSKKLERASQISLRAVLSPSRSQKLSERGADILEKLFSSIFKKPELLPPEFAARLKTDTKETVTADFVAGMTDDFAIEFVKKI